MPAVWKDSTLKKLQELGFHSHGAAEGYLPEAVEIGRVPEEAVPKALDSK